MSSSFNENSSARAASCSSRRALEKLKAEGRIDRVRTQITILHINMADADCAMSSEMFWYRSHQAHARRAHLRRKRQL
jgi:hypothetical protein